MKFQFLSADLEKLFCEPMVSFKNDLKPVSYSVFQDLSEKLSWKILSRNIFERKRNLRQVVKLSVFDTFSVFSIFRPEKRVYKTQGTCHFDRREILYRMV